jgi:hypothetical protein
MPFDKERYWINRKEGRRGQDDSTASPISKDNIEIDKAPDNAVISFGNDGTLVVKNRAYRRQRVKLPGSNQYTKPKRKPRNKNGRNRK